MPALDVLERLTRRDTCRDSWGNYVDCDRNDWYWWGRYVLAGVAIFIILAVAVSCAFISRRRRRRGMQPFRGTGWMAPQSGKYGVHNQNAYNMGGYNQGQPAGGYGNEYASPPPAYGQQAPQYTGTTFNPNDGYYGGQQQGHVQAPTNTYQPDNVYGPPAGPPPGK